MPAGAACSGRSEVAGALQALQKAGRAGREHGASARDAKARGGGGGGGGGAFVTSQPVAHNAATDGHCLHPHCWRGPPGAGPGGGGRGGAAAAPPPPPPPRAPLPPPPPPPPNPQPHPHPHHTHTAGHPPAGSLDMRPADLSWGSSFTPALVWRVEVGARPKRPATRGSMVDSTMICLFTQVGEMWDGTM